MSTAFIDYTQYKDFAFCEQKWYERFVKGVVREPFAVGPSGKDDPLTLGALVHAGLEQYRNEGTPELPGALINELSASAECCAWARLLLQHYVQRYPAEPFTLFKCEAPLRFDLRLPAITGFAKLDYYVHIEQPTEFDSGLGWGTNFVLTPGWYVREYKTFAASRDRGLWLESWRCNMQADFQIHALSEHIGEKVQGIFVDVLEKPAPYVPKRTCKGECRQPHKLADWTPKDGAYACPQCGHVQKLDTSDKSKKERRPEFYRFAVTRTDEQLARSRAEIKRAAVRMMQLIRETVPDDGPLRREPERCISTTRGVSAKCEYFYPHIEGTGATGYDGFVAADTLKYAAASEAPQLVEVGESNAE